MEITQALPKFYLIVDDVHWLERFLPLGLGLVQLRIKDQTDTFVRDQIKQAKSLCGEFNCQLIINDYWQAAIDLGCDYVHLGQEDLEKAELQTLRTHGVRFGLSTHDGTELEIALASKPDYIALGPVYPTAFKAMHWAAQGIDKITQWKQMIGSVPLVAIGGLNIERAPAVYQAGANCICVVTDVLWNDSPESRLQQWLQLANDADFKSAYKV